MDVDQNEEEHRSVKDLAKMLEGSIFMGVPGDSPMKRSKAPENIKLENKSQVKANLNDFFKTLGQSLGPKPPSMNQNKDKELPTEEKWKPDGKQKVDAGRIRQSMDNLIKVLKTGMEFHYEFRDQVQRDKNKLFRMKNGFMAKIKADDLMFQRIDGFWNKFKRIISSSFPQQKTFTTILGTVLIGLVEARQLYSDIVEFGKRSGENTKSIMKSKIISILVEAIDDLEKELDCVLYFVGSCLASESAAKEAKTISIGKTNTIQHYHGAEFEDSQTKKPEIILPSLVEAPLIWLRERLDTRESGDCQVLIAGLFKIETQTKAFYKQGYDDIILLLFIAETVGKVSNEVACQPSLRKKFHETLVQVFSIARANYLAVLKQEYHVNLRE